MTIEEIRDIVRAALPLRPPKFTGGPGPRAAAAVKIAALEDYLLESAHMQAELEEALFWLESLVEQLKNQVEQMTGWETMLPPKRRERLTQQDINEAKRMSNPGVFEAGSEVKVLRQTVLRQIDRLRFEAGNGPVSRAYTLISGG